MGEIQPTARITKNKSLLLSLMMGNHQVNLHSSLDHHIFNPADLGKCYDRIGLVPRIQRGGEKYYGFVIECCTVMREISISNPKKSSKGWSEIATEFNLLLSGKHVVEERILAASDYTLCGDFILFFYDGWKSADFGNGGIFRWVSGKCLRRMLCSSHQSLPLLSGNLPEPVECCCIDTCLYRILADGRHHL